MDLGVGPVLGVPAGLPAADVRVPGDDAGALEGAAQDVLGLPSLGPHLPLLVREEPPAGIRAERVLEEGDELLRDRHNPLLLALREGALVGTPRDEEPVGEIDVALLEPAQLALTEAGEDGGGEDEALLGGERREEGEHLFRREDVHDCFWDPASLHVLRRVGPVPLPGLPRLVECADEELANLVDGGWRELPLLRLEQLLDVASLDMLEELSGDRRAEDVVADRALVAHVRRVMAAVGVEPPPHHVPDRPALQVLGARNEPEPLALDFQLLLVQL